MWSTNRRIRMVCSCAVLALSAGLLHSRSTSAQKVCKGTTSDGYDWKYEGELKDENNCETKHGKGTRWYTKNGSPTGSFTGHWVDNQRSGDGEEWFAEDRWKGISLRGSWANGWLHSVSSATLPKRLRSMSKTKLLILADQWAQEGDRDSPAAIYRWLTDNTDGTVALKAADRLRDHLANLSRRAEAERQANCPEQNDAGKCCSGISCCGPRNNSHTTTDGKCLCNSGYVWINRDNQNDTRCELAPQAAPRRLIVEYTYTCECECGQNMLSFPKEKQLFTVTAASKDEAEAKAYDIYGKGPAYSKNRTVSLGNCPWCYCNRSN